MNWFKEKEIYLNSVKDKPYQWFLDELKIKSIELGRDNSERLNIAKMFWVFTIKL